MVVVVGFWMAVGLFGFYWMLLVRW